MLRAAFSSRFLFGRSISKPLCNLFSTSRVLPNDGKTLDDFFDKQSPTTSHHASYSEEVKNRLNGHSFVIETYGCQMNRADSEIMETLLSECGMTESKNEEEADVIIMNTCSVREHAESRIWNRLKQFRNLDKKYKKRTILCISGCMATRLRTKLLESGVDVVVGPDSYVHLPPLIFDAFNGKQAFHTELNGNNDYDAISPSFLEPLPATQITIMRGCNNMCSYCVVPYTRGRERSVDVDVVLREVKRAEEHGYKEIMLLGQNVNSYCDRSHLAKGSEKYETTPGFRSPTSTKAKTGILFPELLRLVAEEVPETRIRFMSPHPKVEIGGRKIYLKDFPMSVLEVIAEHPNICRSLHLPLQSGSNSCLQRMNRPYTREAFIQLVDAIRSILPDCAISTDVIAGFCGETEAEHAGTVELMREIGFDHAFMYLYSMRENTYAWRYFKDDIPLEVKKRRLVEIQDAFYSTLREKLPSQKGKVELVLVEGESKRSKPGEMQMKGRCDGNRMCVFDVKPVFETIQDYRANAEGKRTKEIRVGEYVACRIETPGTGTHVVQPLFKTSIREFDEWKKSFTSLVC